MERLGITQAFDPRETDVPAELLERTGGLGVDVAIECAGNSAALAACIESTRAGGTIGQPSMHVKEARFDALKLTMNALTLVGTWCAPFYDFDRIVRLVASGRMPVKDVISKRIPLDTVIDDGFKELLSPATGDMKIVVEPG
jgi:(R,R)-butanediol dehydrogenase/meso-butanediol dehydrogenase/diacetyl reductase